MKKTLYLLGFLGIGLIMAACGTTKKAADLADLNGEWKIVTVDGAAVKTQPEGQTAPFLGFDFAEQRVYGNAGCNQLTGTFKSDEKNSQDGISFGPIGATMMMCPDMTTEQAVLRALNETKKFSVSGNKIVFYNANGIELITLEKKNEK